MTAPPRCALRAGEPAELAPLLDATTGAPPRRATRVTLVDLGEALRVVFRCESEDPWATIATRDGDLWTEEVVEVFLAPGTATPDVYFEIEVNPLGTLFDARVTSPHGDRRDLRVDRGWHAAGLAAEVAHRAAGEWRAEVTLPWSAIGGGRHWRANFFRIDRPRARGPAVAPEFSAWSPTFARPADFHRPARFGFLERIG